MARKNIFEIIASKTDFSSDVERIDKLFSEYYLLCDIDGRNDDTIKDYVDTYLFHKWKSRGHCIDVEDFLKTADYNNNLFNARIGDFDSFVIVVEIIYNFWLLVKKEIDDDDDLAYNSSFCFLKNIMDECLSHYNLKAFIIEDLERVIIAEDKPEITAVAEIVNNDIAYKIIRYNHHSMHGDVEGKKSILLSLGSELEPKRDRISSINSTLTSDIFFLLNNLNIRHNNVDSTSKHYKKAVSMLESEQLEDYYDELYQMILLAFLELDQSERTGKIKALKRMISGEDENG